MSPMAGDWETTEYSVPRASGDEPEAERYSGNGK